MSQLLRKLERMSGIQMSAIAISGKPIITTFPAEHHRLLKVSTTHCNQLLAHGEEQHIVTAEEGEVAHFDEAHLHINDSYIFGLRLSRKALFIGVMSSRNDLFKTQKTLRSARPVLNKFVDSLAARRQKK